MNSSEPPQFAAAVTTIGIVVPDIWSAMAEYDRLLGWRDWRVYHQQPPSLTQTSYRGAPSSFSMLVAGTQSAGPVPVWLVQPLDGQSLYREMLDRNGGGQFIALWQKSDQASDALTARLLDAGADSLMTGAVEGSIHFEFLDTTPVLGVVVEVGAGDSRNQELHATYPRAGSDG